LVAVDEMRFGLWGQVRRRWGHQGMKIVQPNQMVFVWQDLVVAMDVGRCELHWNRTTRMNQDQVVPVFAAWSPDVVIWDGATPILKHARLGGIGIRFEHTKVALGKLHSRATRVMSVGAA
jgi:hypothetical protein